MMNYPKNQLLSFKYEYCKMMYENELENRHKISDKLSMLLTIIIAVVSASIWCINKLSKTTTHTILFFTTFILLIITNIIIVLSILFFIIGYRKYNSTYIVPENIQKMFNEAEQLTQIIEENSVVETVKNVLSKEYISAAINNYNETNIRVGYINKSTKLIIISLCLLFASYLFIINV